MHCKTNDTIVYIFMQGKIGNLLIDISSCFSPDLPVGFR